MTKLLLKRKGGWCRSWCRSRIEGWCWRWGRCRSWCRSEGWCRSGGWCRSEGWCRHGFCFIIDSGIHVTFKSRITYHGISGTFTAFKNFHTTFLDIILKTILSSMDISCLHIIFTWCITGLELSDGLRYNTWWSWAGVYPACPCVPDAATSVVVIPHSKIGISQASVLEGPVPSSWG